MTNGRICPVDGRPVVGSVRGPARLYCSDRCKMRAARRRALGLPIDFPPMTRDGLVAAATQIAHGWTVEQAIDFAEREAARG